MALVEKDLNLMSDQDDEVIPVKKKSNNNKRMSVERIYQKKSQLEHILLRPDSYIGSVEPAQEKMWVLDEENNAIINKTITFTPGLYKIFDEIIVNAADNKQRDPRMNTIKVNIDVEKNTISIWNNGKGIPIEMHKTENMYVPTLIFGHLLTSSNYDDTEKKVVGGRNGFGAKLCNIFSTKFTVETASNGKKFKQTWKNNMGKAETEKVTDCSGTDFTCITFSPDLPKFKMEKLDNDFVALLKRRAYDIAGVSRGVSVVLNGEKLKVKSFKDYVQYYIKGAALKKDGIETEPPKIIHEIVNPRWEVCITVSETGFQQSSFVNSIATTKGGTHINYLVDQICEKLIAAVKKKTGKGGFNIKPFQVKSHLWVFANTLIENPTFDSQTKENMTLRKSSFGSTCELSDKYIKQVQDCGVLDNILSWVRFKSEAQLNKKTFAQKHSKLKGIPKLDDANDAGTKNSRNCTLIVTEGDSAKALAMAGLSVIGRDKYGVFPLRGKMLNVRDATHKQIMDNAEVGYLLKIIGLQFGKKYTEEDMKSLRYGHLMIMADQDTDGSHIKGLVINFIHANWPSLLKLDFLEEFITPIVKATKGKEVHSFFSIPEFEEWQESTSNNKSWRIKYYKGLGTSTGKEGKEYFSNLLRHRIVFDYDGPSSDQALVMAFSKKCINERKNWLTTGMEERKLRKEAGLPVIYLYEKNTKSVSYPDFVNKELILFSNADNERSIPCLVDGLKPGQRKVLFTCMKRNDKSEVKVAQLAGSVAEMSAYHHGEASLMGTIVGLAQNFVGSNNLNILEPHGQFGTRTLGGKDSASPRYIFTKMSILTRLIYPAHDDHVLSFLFEDNKKIEPEWYCPIIPMVLVNGADGIGTGWATKIPNYDVRDLISVLKNFIAGEEPSIELKPSYKEFKGDVEKVDTHRYSTYGVISVIDETTVEISELPVKVWTQPYKENTLDVLLYGNEKTQPMISDYKEYHTDVSVKFIVTMTPEQLKKAEEEGLHKVFKLDSSFSTSSMVLFDEFGCIRKFDTVYEIIEMFQKIRLQKYQERRVFLLGMLEAECSKLENQARFILEKIDGKIVIENRVKRDIVTNLVERGFQSDPIKVWKASIQVEVDDDEGGDRETNTNAPSSVASSSGGPDFQYLLTMSLMSLSREKKEELLRQRDEKKDELEALRKKSPQDLWLDELDILLAELDKVEEQERLDNKSSAAIKKIGQKSAKGRVAKPKIDLAAAATAGGREVKPVKPPPKVVKEPKKPRAAAKPKEEKVEKEKVEKQIQEPTEKIEIDITDENSNNGETLSLADRLKKNNSASKKQSTLNFQKKKKTFSDSDDSDDNFQPVVEVAPSSRSVRQKEPKKYAVDIDSDSDGSDGKDSDCVDDDTFGVVKSKTTKTAAGSINGNTDEAKTRALIETLSPMKKKTETSTSTKRAHKSDKSEEEKEPPKKKVTSKSDLKEKPITVDDSDDDDVQKHDEPSKKPAAKKTAKTPFSFDDSSDGIDDKSSDEEPVKKKPAAKKPAAKKPAAKKTLSKPVKKGKKLGESDESGSDVEPAPKKKNAAPKKSSTKTKKSRKFDGSSDDDESDFDGSEAADEPVPVRERVGRATAATTKAKYKFSSSEDDDDDSDFC